MVEFLLCSAVMGTGAGGVDGQSCHFNLSVKAGGSGA
jgi:hypothetical protein